jgi:hypothetical protein
MATGADFLLDALLKLTGINVEDAKAHILDLGRKFYEQDALLKQIHDNQKMILAQQQLILNKLQIGEDDNGQIIERHSIERNGGDAGSAILR